MSSKAFFILGTDTGVGKTSIAITLLSILKKAGYSTIGLKPIASGAKKTSAGLRNADALCLQKAASLYLPYKEVNPFCFSEAIAPHIAAKQQTCRLSVKQIIKKCQSSLEHHVDYCVIEGVGGVCVPLNERETMLDLIQAWGFPVILVVGLRLGCLNHALLTYESLVHRRNISITAWLCNQVDPYLSYCKENVTTLQEYIHSPFLGFIPYLKRTESLLINTEHWIRLILSKNKILS